jgi:hypothetical protein
MTDYRFSYLGLNAKRQKSSGVGAATVNLGSMSGKGSSTRIFNYCRATSVIPDNCFNHLLGINSETNKSPDWASLGSGLNDKVEALAFDPSRNRLYAGGNFTATNDASVTLNRICYFDYNTSTWNMLAGGVGSTVHAICIVDTKVFVGGEFSSALDIDGNSVSNTNHICYFDITDNSWHELDADCPDAAVYSIVSDTFNVTEVTLWIGGAFVDIGITEYNRVAKWTTNNKYSRLTSGLFHGIDTSTSTKTVYSISVTATLVYFGGSFDTVQDDPALKKLVSWNKLTNSWNALGSPNFGSNDSVNSIVTIGDKINIGGDFINIIGPGSGGNYFAEFTPSNNQWSKIGKDTVNGTVNIIVVYNNKKYIGGSFDCKISVFDQSNNRTCLGNGLNNTVNAIALRTAINNIVAGGDFISSVSPLLELYYIATINKKL